MARGLFGARGRPRYVCRKEAHEHPMARAMEAVVASSVCRVAKVVLEKLMARPVVCAKLFRITLRVEAAAGEAAATMSVSSAYWRTVGGQEAGGRRWGGGE